MRRLKFSNRCFSGVLSGLLASSLSMTSIGQQSVAQLPTMPPNLQPVQGTGSTQPGLAQPLTRSNTQPPYNQLNQQDPARLQTFELPSELIGTVGARLQILYHGHTRVRVTTDPRTGQLMVMAPESVLREINTRMQTLIAEAKNAGINNDGGYGVGSTQQHTYSLQNLNWREIEETLQRLMGTRLTVTTENDGTTANLRVANPNGMQDLMTVDRRQNQVTLLGSGPAVNDWLHLIHALDTGKSDPNKQTHVLTLAPAEPQTVNRAIKLIRAAFQQSQADGQGANRQSTAGQQGQPQNNTPQPGDNDQVTAMGSLDTLGADSALLGDVQIELLEGSDIVIIRGNKRDVERALQLIDSIKKMSIETAPKVEIYPLQHVNSDAVAALVTTLYGQNRILATRQGQIEVTALGQPNALLLIGREEALNSVKDLLLKLDQPLDPARELRVHHLIHASATDALTTIRNFFVDIPGQGNTARTGLGTRVKIEADYRTNSLIIQASPRDMEEVMRLVEKIDVEGTTAQNAVRVFRLKNATAEELQQVLEEVINGQPAGQGQGNARATPTSTKLVIVDPENSNKTESGILAGVVITADPTVNALVVRAPSQSMELIDKLIEQLDQPPNAEAQIKVFQVKNGDATSLTATLQQIFGLPVTANQGTGGLFGGGNQIQQALVTGGETSLVPLRLSQDVRTNTIIASGTKTDLEVVEVLLMRLDAEGSQTRRTEVFWLRNANAVDVANALTSLIASERQVLQTNILLNQAISVYERSDREIFVVAEQLTNSLVISATPRYYDTIRKVIERLDRRPPLVAIQVMMAEVSLTDALDIGTELGLQDALLFDRNTATGGTLGSPVFNQGVPFATTLPAAQQRLGQNVAGQGLSTFGLGRQNAQLGYGGLVLSAASESVGILFRALQDAGRLQILSRPQIMTMDNRPAQTLVGQNVPRVTGVNNGLNGFSVSTVDTPVGLLLGVTPRVNQDGLIMMSVNIARDTVGSTDTGIPIGFGPDGEVIRSPIINTTSAQSYISAYSGQTVVFAGLITKTRSSASRKIPILGSLPLVGGLFRFEQETEQRTELLVVLTPRLVETDEDYEMIKQVESSRMSWCLADVLNLHSDVGLSGGNGLWGPAKTSTIYPDLQPAVVETNPAMEGESILLDGSNQAQPSGYFGPAAGQVPSGAMSPLQPVSYEANPGLRTSTNAVRNPAPPTTNTTPGVPNSSQLVPASTPPAYSTYTGATTFGNKR